MKNSFFAKFGLMFGLVGLLFLAGCDCNHRVQVVREVQEVVREVPQPIRLPPPVVNHNHSPTSCPPTHHVRPQLKYVPIPVYRCGRIVGTRMAWVPIQVPTQLDVPNRYHGRVFRGY